MLIVRVYLQSLALVLIKSQPAALIIRHLIPVQSLVANSSETDVPLYQDVTYEYAACLIS